MFQKKTIKINQGHTHSKGLPEKDILDAPLHTHTHRLASLGAGLPRKSTSTSTNSHSGLGSRAQSNARTDARVEPNGPIRAGYWSQLFTYIHTVPMFFLTCKAASLPTGHHDPFLWPSYDLIFFKLCLLPVLQTWPVLIYTNKMPEPSMWLTHGSLRNINMSAPREM